jgi:hypothetical protein
MDSETAETGQSDPIDVTDASAPDVAVDAHLEAAYDDRCELDEASR